MQKVYERCSGIDVHKQMIVICLKKGKQTEIRQFGTYTRALREMTAWLKEQGCQMVAMDSTGPYWKPLFNQRTADYCRNWHRHGPFFHRQTIYVPGQEFVRETTKVPVSEKAEKQTKVTEF